MEETLGMQIEKAFKGIEIKKIVLKFNVRKGTVHINITGREGFLMPDDGNYDSAMVRISLETNKESGIELEYEAYAEYKFDGAPEDYKDFIMNECLPDLRNRSYKIIDEIVEKTGHSSLNFENMKPKENKQ